MHVWTEHVCLDQHSRFPLQVIWFVPGGDGCGHLQWATAYPVEAWAVVPALRHWAHRLSCNYSLQPSIMVLVWLGDAVGLIWFLRKSWCSVAFQASIQNIKLYYYCTFNINRGFKPAKTRWSSLTRSLSSGLGNPLQVWWCTIHFNLY